MKSDGAASVALSIKPLQIHDKYLVQWRGSNRVVGGDKEFIYLPAVIIERRPARNRESSSSSLDPSQKRKRKATHVETSSATSDDIDSLPADAVEYYIHYIEHDRFVTSRVFGLPFRFVAHIVSPLLVA